MSRLLRIRLDRRARRHHDAASQRNAPDSLPSHQERRAAANAASALR